MSRTRCSVLTMRRRAGTHTYSRRSMDPGSAAHHTANHSASKTRVNALVALRRVRGTQLFPAACIQTFADLLVLRRARSFNKGAREIAMAKGQMRSNKEKKKPKADKNIKKGGATPSPFAAGKTPAGQSPNSKKS